MSIASRMPFERSSSRGAGSFGIRKFRKYRELLPIRIREGQDRRDERVRPREGLRLALEIDLPVLIEVRLVGGNARVEDRIQLVTVSAGQIESDKLINLLWLIYLVAVQCGLQVMQPIGVCLVAEDGGAIVRSRMTLGSSPCRS